MKFISTVSIDALLESHPAISKDVCYPIFISEGWFQIIKDLCSCLNIHVIDQNLSFSILNVENKFGTLYIAKKGGDYFTHKAIHFAEQLSYRTCEQCGNIGSLHSSNVTQFTRYATLCDVDALKRLYRRV